MTTNDAAESTVNSCETAESRGTPKSTRSSAAGPSSVSDGRQLLGARNVGTRSNFSLLDFEDRLHIIFMLHDGATAKQILDDPAVIAGCRKKNIKLNAPSISRIKRSSKEYRDVTAQRKREADSIAGDRMTAAILRDIGSADVIGDTVKIELLQLVKGCIGNAETPADVQRLVRSVIDLGNHDKDREIERLKKRIEELESQLSGQTKSGGLTPETMQKIEEKIGML